jgi:hypothetical protein
MRYAVTDLSAESHARLTSWLQPQPREKMLVYDRNGACLGRVKQIARCADGHAQSLVVTGTGLLASQRRERRLDVGHCHVRAGAVHTSYCLAQLDGQAVH